MKPIQFVRSLRFSVVLLCVTAAYVASAAIFGFGYRTVPFLAILGLFTVNLAACTAHRLLYRAHRRFRDYLPDVIHSAVVVVLIGSVGSLYGRSETPVPLSTGDEFTIGGRYEMRLLAAQETETNWISTFEIHDRTTGTTTRGETRVNAPLRIDDYRVFQSRFAMLPVIDLIYVDGRRYTLAEGEGFGIGESLFVLEGVASAPPEPPDGDSGVLPFQLVWFVDEVEQARVPVRVGTRFGDLTVVGSTTISRTVVTVVRDPGAVIVLAGGAVLAAATVILAISRSRSLS